MTNQQHTHRAAQQLPPGVSWSDQADARQAWQLVQSLQECMRNVLEGFSSETLAFATWQRSGGRHGGGHRFVSPRTAHFNRAAINISQVHYPDDDTRTVACATALSTIVHPNHPRAPSVHLHVSLTQMKSGPGGGWRIMADLNPAIVDDGDVARFRSAVRAAEPERCDEAFANGDRYFWIPACGRHRGVAHFYLEGVDHDAGSAAMAQRVIASAIDVYGELLATAKPRAVADTDARAQLAYHTLYLFQVLTLDRGTTSGLMVHDENDLGIMGSLPSQVDPALLLQWRARAPAAQHPLIDLIVSCIPADGTVHDDARRQLASALRTFYRAHPDALALQAK